MFYGPRKLLEVWSMNNKCGREQLDLSFNVLQLKLLLMYMLLQLFKSSHQAIFLRLWSLKKLKKGFLINMLVPRVNRSAYKSTDQSISRRASSDCFSSHLTHPVLAGRSGPAICITSSSKLHESYPRALDNRWPTLKH